MKISHVTDLLYKMHMCGVRVKFSAFRDFEKHGMKFKVMDEIVSTDHKMIRQIKSSKWSIKIVEEYFTTLFDPYYDAETDIENLEISDLIPRHYSKFLKRSSFENGKYSVVFSGDYARFETDMAIMMILVGP